MARTAEMRLIELMVLKQDISAVIEYIGKKESFQFQDSERDRPKDKKSDNELDVDSNFYTSLRNASVNLGIPLSDSDFDVKNCSSPTAQDREDATRIIKTYNDLQEELEAKNQEVAKCTDAYKEALAFANLKVSFSELDSLSFLSLRVGKIDAAGFDSMKSDLAAMAVVIALGEDKSHVLVASSKKNSAQVDIELKRLGFVALEIPKDFQGVPQDVLDGLSAQKKKVEAELEELETTRANFAETHKAIIHHLIEAFAIGVQISDVVKGLESTELVYRITGWVPYAETETYMKELDSITSGRIAFREYSPFEVPSVVSGKEQVPVKLSHGKFVKSFERMIFSYGAPLYGTIDPTPFVAVFFTLLFGIMFGDLGQGLVFVLVGILMAAKVIKVGGWNKFAPIFMAIGISSSIMGLLTGEFFSNETLLEPFAEWVTGFFGTPHAPILKMMPSSDPSSIVAMFGVFGVAVGIGFIINTIGLLLNIINNLRCRRFDEAFFGKNGLAGAIFFWYVIVMIIRMVVFHHAIAVYDWIVIGISLFLAAFAEPFENLVAGRRPVLENGFGTYLISGVVELIEVISGYLSNTVSFVRVGAFALSHAVLDFLILTLTNMCGGEGSVVGILILVVGNAIIILLEGMIVAIQVIRLQYYEFFSKFFHETGREFKPFRFVNA
ncbi:MAG: ATPase [Treponema sp.]|nr:ATPase [Treponema sp.]